MDQEDANGQSKLYIGFPVSHTSTSGRAEAMMKDVERVSHQGHRCKPFDKGLGLGGCQWKMRQGVGPRVVEGRDGTGCR